LTLRHFDLGASPLTSANVALGWVGVLDALKTLLETGEPLGPVTIEASAVDDTAWHRQLAVAANGEAWALLGRERLDAADLDELLERAHASAYHWRRAAPPEAPEQARAAWLLARCHTIAGHGDLALHHAERCATLTSADDEDRAILAADLAAEPWFGLPVPASV
jgi:hypothetical protein